LKFWIKLIFFGFLFYCFAWYIRWSINPYRDCIDHPDPKLKEIWYAQCEPFGIEMKKSWRIITDPEGRGEKYYEKLIKENKRINKEKNLNKKGKKLQDTRSLDYYE
jgi:hypothetical protein